MDMSGIRYIRPVANDTEAPNRIRELREAVGMTQVELARRIHVTPPALQKVEVGARKLDQVWMRRISDALGVTPAELLPEADNPWALSDEEKDLIMRLRTAREADRKKFSGIANVVLDFPAAEDDAA